MKATYGVLPQWLQDKVDAIKRAITGRARVLFDWVWGEPGSEFATWLMHVQRNGLYRALSVERIVSIYRWAAKRVADKGVDPMPQPLPLALRWWWDQEFVDADGQPDHNPPGWRAGHELSAAALAKGTEDSITRWHRLVELALANGYAPPLKPFTLGVIDPDTRHTSYRDWFAFPKGMSSITLREALEDPRYANPTLLAEVKKRLAEAPARKEI
jgi:hypothetical protein